MPQQSPQSNCPALRQQYRELQELKAEFDRELERAAITKNTGAALALKNQLEQKEIEIMNTLLETDDEHALACLLKQHESGRELTIANLRFLYKGIILIKKYPYKQEIDLNSLRVLNDIRNQRNIKQDLSRITGFPEEQISTTKQEAFSGNIMLHYGDLDLGDLTSADGLKLPASIGGDLILDNLTSADGLELPASIGEHLYLNSLKSAVGLELPANIGGTLHLYNLTSADGLELPASIGGTVYFRALPNAEIDGLRKKYPNLWIIKL